jgi:protein-disulfide isomerase
MEQEKIENIIQTEGNVTIVEEELAVPKPNFMALYSTPIAILVAGIIIAGAILVTRFAPAGTGIQTNGNPDTKAVNIKDVKTVGAPYIGEKNAPVTIAYWTDYQCPFCKQFETTTMTQIMDNYVKNGKVKIVFKDFQFLGPDSTVAGLYGRAVWDLYPAEYFTWREAMFTKQDNEQGGFGNETSIKALTATIAGIDATKVSKAVTDKKAEYQKQIDADKTEGGTFGINGTPGFIIGTKIIAGSLPYAEFTQAIDAVLKK